MPWFIGLKARIAICSGVSRLIAWRWKRIGLEADPLSQWLHVGMVKLAFPSSAMRPKCEACVSTSAAIRGERRTFACTSTGQKGGRHPFLTKPFGSIPAARFPRLWSPASTPTYDRNTRLEIARLWSHC